MKLIYLLYFIGIVLLVKVVVFTDKSIKQRVYRVISIFIIMALISCLYMNMTVDMSDMYQVTSDSYLSIYIDADHKFYSEDLSNKVTQDVCDLFETVELKPTINVLPSSHHKMYGQQ